jgi:hypothetical protein
MKLLSFQAKRFAWRPHARSLDTAEDAPAGDAVDETVVVFVHAEERDQEDESRSRALRHAQKHVTWLANKRELSNVVLHSFTHLSGTNADPAFASAFLSDLAAILERKGYRVRSTPFGWTCAWELSVHGESLAKVWKEI